METHDNKFYYSPVPDEKTYEESLNKASYLVDNGYVNITDGLTFDTLVNHLVQLKLSNKTSHQT